MRKPILIEITIWTIILCIVFTGIIFTYSKIFVEPNVYVINFKDIDGITEGSPVRFMGINVGYVRKLKSRDKHIKVQILITKKDMKIPNGTIARVEFYGLGASKSIELMPPDGSCDVGILTGDTIRINDVAKEAGSLVEIMEAIEKYIKGLNKQGMEKFLNSVVDMKDTKIKDVDYEITNIESSLSEKTHIMREKQSKATENIQKINENIKRINEFIKK